jgi:hypothetical protein
MHREVTYFDGQFVSWLITHFVVQGLNEEQRLRVFEGGVLMKRFGPKTVEGTGVCRERPKEELLKSLMGKPEGKRPVEDLGIDGN